MSLKTVTLYEVVGANRTLVGRFWQDSVIGFIRANSSKRYEVEDSSSLQSYLTSYYRGKGV